MPGIHVDAVDFARIVQQIIQRIASSAGDHRHFALLVQLQELPVATRIFPAGIIHQVIEVDFLKDPVSELVDWFQIGRYLEY